MTVVVAVTVLAEVVAEAVTVAVPALIPVANPELLMVRVDVSEDVHVTSEVMSCVVLSAKVPVAVNWLVVPFVIVGVVGEILMELSVAVVTTTMVLPWMFEEEAVIVAFPAALAVTSPAALTAATVELLLVQVALLVISDEVPLPLTPVAVYCCVSLTFMKRLVGVTLM